MVAFIILHYNNIKDTLECIASIKRTCAHFEFKIIAVDNASINKEDNIKIKKRVDDLITLKTNVGFAKGNNVGCSYAIKKYNPSFLVVINNDTIITDNAFLQIVKETYNRTNFDVLGPKILTNNGDSVNPFSVINNKEIDSIIKKNNMLIKIYDNKFLSVLLKNYINFKKIMRPVEKKKNGIIEIKDIPLHGCAMIFSKKYYKKYKDVFYPNTFLYHEEEFLNYRRVHDNLIFVYNPLLKIFHKEDSSLNDKYDYNQKQKFRRKEINKSLLLLKEVINNDKKI